MSNEEWRPVAGYGGLYEVSSLGRVRSLPRYFLRGDTPIPVRSRIMKTQESAKGHLVVGLRKDNRAQTLYVHRLVCEAFHGPAPEGKPNALHWDDVKSNNTSGNLRWGSDADNSRDLIRNGLHAPSNATHCPRNHEYSEENTYRHPTKGYRVCRICRLEGQRRRALSPCPEDYHGTLTGYTSYHCRCEECREAWSEYSHKRRSR